MEITIGSLFDGIGGFPLAGVRNGMTAIWASEIETFPIKVTQIRFPNMKHYGDITKINGSDIEPVDIITGGSPCQDLSVAGKRAGLAGARSGLFMEQIRIVRELRENDRRNNARSDKSIRPRFMVWENVPGAFSSQQGEDFKAVLEEICRVKEDTVSIPQPVKNKWLNRGCIMGDGYSVAWRILDAQFWGVAQRRRRIYLVADFGGNTAPEILFKRESLSRYIAKGRQKGQGITTDAERSIKKAISIDAYCLQGNMIGRNDKNVPQGDGINENVSFTLNTTDRHAVATKVYGICSDASNSMKSDNPHSGIYEAKTSRTLDQNGGSPACNQGGMAIVQTYQKTTGPLMANTHPGSYSGQDAYTDMFVTPYQNKVGALCSSDSKGMQVQMGTQDKYIVGKQYSVRRLTPLECERLQNYPDGWTDIPSASDSSRYKALGNSIAVCCAEYVLEGIKEVIEAGN